MKKNISILFTLFFWAPTILLSRCPSHYSEMTMQDHTKLFSIHEFEWWTKEQVIDGKKVKLAISPFDALPDGVGISVKIQYSGQFRVITPDSYKALDKFGGAKMKSLYTQELEVHETGFHGWVLVQADIVEKLKEQFKEGEQIFACLVLIGVLNDNHLYVMNNFSATSNENELENSDNSPN